MDKQTKQVVFLFCLVKLVIHLIADYHSGFQGDELLHIEAGNHPAWGYMEFPPLIGWLAFIQNLFQSQSIFIHHLFPHLAAVLILIYVSRITVALGGKWKAVFLVLLCLVPIMGRSQQLFQPVIFSQLFWVMSFFYLIQYVKFLDRKHLWYLTFSLALGFLTKYDILFFIAGLSGLLLFKHIRHALINHKFWWHLVVFILIISPNILWQYLHDFPVRDMFSRLYETQLNHLSPTEILLDLIVSLNPFTLLISLPAVFGMFHPRMRKYRVLSITIGISILLLTISKGKPYYYYPIVLTILPFGGVFWEAIILNRKKWLLYPASALLILSGIILLPFSLPLTSLESYLENEYQYEQKEIPGGKYAVKEERYSSEKWQQTLSELKKVYANLPPVEQETALIWGKHYGQAGAVALFGQDFGLPEPFSLHGSFYLWLPEGEMPNTTISLRYSTAAGSDFFEPYFRKVTPVKSIYNPYADEEEQVWQTIFLCEDPKQDFATLKKLFEDRVFE